MLDHNHPKFINSIESMMSDATLCMAYYGEFCQFINFKEDVIVKTCGVFLNDSGMQCLYNSVFLEKMTQKECNFVLLHELGHLLYDHISRVRKGGFEPELSNIVQDMIINTAIIETMESRFYEPPKNVFFIPKEYKEDMIFEYVYDWIYEKRKLYLLWKMYCKCWYGEPLYNNDCKCEGCPVSEELKKIFDDLYSGLTEWLDDHLPSDIPDEFRKDTINNIKEYLKNNNLVTPNVKMFLDRLKQSKKDHLKDIKIGINGVFGDNVTKVICKRNRRSIEGLKGKRKEYSILNVILDVSSSMDGWLEKSLSYIFQSGIIINLVQCDTEVTDFKIIKNKKELSKLEIIGGGGTKLMSGIKYIKSNNKLISYNTLILTDGETDILDFSGLKKVLIISNHVKCRVSGTNRSVKQIVVND